MGCATSVFPPAQEALKSLLSGNPYSTMANEVAKHISEVYGEMSAKQRRERKLGEEYLKLQWANTLYASKDIAKISKPLSYFEEKQKSLPDSELQHFYNYVRIGREYNNIANACFIHAEGALHACYQFLTFASMRYIHGKAGEGLTYPPFLPDYSVMVEDGEWSGIYQSGIVHHLRHFFTYRAVMQMFTDLYSSKAVDLTKVLYDTDKLRAILAYTNTAIAESLPKELQPRLASIEDFIPPEERVKPVRDALAAYDLHEPHDFQFMELARRIAGV